MENTLSNTRPNDDRGGSTAPPRSASLYVVLEGERPLAGGLRASLEGVREIFIGRGASRAWSVDPRGGATLTIPDPRMSSKHARLVRDGAGWTIEDAGSTNGVIVDGARVARLAVDRTTLLTLGATVLQIALEEPYPEGTRPFVEAAALAARPAGLRTLVPSIEHEATRLVRIAMATLPILLLGESGAGKEVLARAIHRTSGRKGPFVAINCGAIAPTLVESQLFGHVRGAFSGALKDEPGLVRSAHGGTLFLDEIGELPAAAQATLLRVLQEREVLPVGGTKPVAVDLRVVSATLKPIDATPSFRPDLYARVAAFVFRLVPLAERRADIGLLVADLLPRVAAERAQALRFAPDLATALVRHRWPQNVRGLEHALSVAVVTSDEDLLRVEHAGIALDPPPIAEEGQDREPEEPAVLSEEDEKLRADLTEILTRTRGNVSEIAREWGKTRMQIHRWMKRFKITPETFRS